MKTLIEKFHWDYFATRKMKITNEGLSIDYSNLIRTNHWDIKFSEYKSDFIFGKKGETGWGSPAFTLIIVALILSIFNDFSSNLVVRGVLLLLMDVLILISGFLFILRFKKNDYIYFSEKEDGSSLSIKITKNSKEFVDELKSKILKANEQQG